MTGGSGIIKHKTMAQAAAEALRQRILVSDYPPGLQLKQESLAKELGVSRIPLREALLILESEGLVQMLPHRGAVVAELTFHEVDELFSMRMLMEPWLLQRSAHKLTEEDFVALQKVQDDYAQSLDSNDIVAWNGLNKDFHMRLYVHSDSPRMMGLVANLLTECDIHTRYQLLHIPGSRAGAVAQHDTLLELCRAGDIDRAVVELHDHIDHIRRSLLELASRRKSES